MTKPGDSTPRANALPDDDVDAALDMLMRAGFVLRARGYPQLADALIVAEQIVALRELHSKDPAVVARSRNAEEAFVLGADSARRALFERTPPRGRPPTRVQALRRAMWMQEPLFASQGFDGFVRGAIPMIARELVRDVPAIDVDDLRKVCRAPGDFASVLRACFAACGVDVHNLGNDRTKRRGRNQKAKRHGKV